MWRFLSGLGIGGTIPLLAAEPIATMKSVSGGERRAPQPNEKAAGEYEDESVCAVLVPRGATATWDMMKSGGTLPSLLKREGRAPTFLRRSVIATGVAVVLPSLIKR